MSLKKEKILKNLKKIINNNFEHFPAGENGVGALASS